MLTAIVLAARLIPAVALALTLQSSQSPDREELQVVPSEHEPEGQRFTSKIAAGNSFVRNKNGTMDVCFVHIGKAGGESVNTGLREMQAQGGIDHLIQIHQRGGSHVPTPPYSKLGGSVIDGVNEKVCADTGNVVVWVRDPIARFLSCWRAKIGPETRRAGETGFGPLGSVLKNAKVISDREQLKHIDRILTKLSRRKDGHHVLSKAMQFIPHATTAAPFYLGKCDHLEKLPIKFVGTTESMDGDWRDFLTKTMGPSTNITMTRTHGHKLQHSQLSETSIAFLADQEELQEEMRCLRELENIGFLSTSYVDSAMRSNKTYNYHRRESEVVEDFYDEWDDGEDEDIA